MKHYDIEGKEIHVATCQNCGHQIDVTQIYNAECNGAKYPSNCLMMVKDIAGCCKEPFYLFD